MAIITYGKSIGPKTSKGRRRARRIEAARQQAEAEGKKYVLPQRMPTKAEKIGKRDATPRYILATSSDLSFRIYTGNISYTQNDAMYKLINHAHQRDPRKKWS